MNTESARVLLVVPSLGRRPHLLREALDSIVRQGTSADIILVSPINDETKRIADDFKATLIADPGGLPQAINLGVANAQSHHDYVNWLGDDDLLEDGSLARTTEALEQCPDAVVAYGACRYIDGEGRELWVNKAGPWASWMLSWGPDLIPQPGMLIRRTAWERVGGVDPTYRFAFDLDLLLRLKRYGRLINVGGIVASFRWHPDSLTVGDRSTNLAESERAKRTALGPVASHLRWLWEPPVRGATRAAAWELSRRAQRMTANR